MRGDGEAGSTEVCEKSAPVEISGSDGGLKGGLEMFARGSGWFWRVDGGRVGF